MSDETHAAAPPSADTAARPWTDTSKRDRRARGGAAGRDDARREARPARQRVARRASSARATSRRCRTAFADPASFEEAARARHGAPDPPARHPPGRSGRGRAPARRAASATLVERTRLGIPAIAHEECLTGFTTFGATVVPHGARLGGDVRPGARGADGPRHRRGHARRRRPPGPLARRWTSCATTAGAASRRRSARTRTWSA